METTVMEQEVFEGFEGTEFESNTEETFETVSAVSAAEVAPHVNKVGNDLVKGFLVGLGTGLAIGVAAWFHERNKRLAILEQLEFSVIVAEGIGKGNEKAVIEGKFKKNKELDLTQIVMNNPATYTKTIIENIGNVRFMSKKERKRWNDLMSNIVSLAVFWNNTAIKTGNFTLSKEAATEVLKEEK